MKRDYHEKVAKEQQQRVGFVRVMSNMQLRLHLHLSELD
jgi:hypothetical protein